MIVWLWAIAPIPECDLECGEVVRMMFGQAPEVVGRNARALPIEGAALAPAMEELRLVLLSAEEALSLVPPRERLRVIA